MWLRLLCLIIVSTCARADDQTSSSDQIPRILRDARNPSSSNVLIAAHRGGYENDRADKAPENSLANIRNCERNGYDLYETDIQRTKDGHFVIVHDPTIDRETSGVGKVSDMTLVELKGLHKRYRDGSLSPERVAALGEFLEEGKGRTVFKADMKPGVSKYFENIMELVAEHDALDGIIFRVPYGEAELYARYRAKGGLCAKHTLMFMVSSRKQIDDIEAHFEPVTIQINLDKSDPLNRKVLDLIRYARKKGLVVETHAEGDARDWAEFIKAGVRIFHTNSPSKMREFLQSLP